MKAYAFRLEPVLKLRKLKEENCKVELGKLLSYLAKIDSQLANDRDAIERYYAIQEATLKTGARSSQLQAFPMLVEAKEKNMQLLLAERERQQTLIDEKIRELAVLKGEVKTMESLREKEYDTWKRAYQKDLDQKIEEQTQNWLGHRRREET